jgi:hypothetical protein
MRAAAGLSGLVGFLLGVGLCTAAAAQGAPAIPGLGGPQSPEQAAITAAMMKRAEAIRTQPDFPGSGPFPADYEAVPQAGLVAFHPVDLARATAQR